MGEFKKIAIELGATQFAGVATEVFRKAKNGSDYLNKVRAEGISMTLVTQELEGELGFNSVYALSGISKEKLIVWVGYNLLLFLL